MRVYLPLFCCAALAAAATTNDKVTFNKDVLPVLQKNCQTCHRPGEVAPMSFLSYQETRPWAKAIKSAVLAKKMPPWLADPKYGHFLNERRLSESDVKALTAWADNGAPEGDAKDKPAPLNSPRAGTSSPTSPSRCRMRSRCRRRALSNTSTS